jgi:beta-fructofuranosidase
VMQYFPGTFNGTHFTAVDAAARISDFSKDNYAGQFFYGTPDGTDPIMIAWASNWQYSQIVPTGPIEGFRSAMTLPRRTYLANVTRTGYTLFQKPYDLSSLYSSELASNSSLGNGSVLIDYSSVSSGAVYFQANVSNIPNNTLAQGTLNFTFSSSVSGERLAGGFFFGGDTPFWLNRGPISGFENPFFTDKFSTTNIINQNGTFTLEGVIDRSILEIFLDSGRQSGTTTFFPTAPLDRLEIATAGLNAGVDVSVVVWGLESAWDAMATDGTVYGNVTVASGGNNTQTVKRA